MGSNVDAIFHAKLFEITKKNIKIAIEKMNESDIKIQTLIEMIHKRIYHNADIDNPVFLSIDRYEPLNVPANCRFG